MLTLVRWKSSRDLDVTSVPAWLGTMAMSAAAVATLSPHARSLSTYYASARAARSVISSVRKNRYRTTHQCYSFSETSSQDEFSTAIRSSNRHVGGECDLGDVRHRLVGWTSTSAFSATLLPLRSLSPRDVAASRKVFVSARSARLRALATCMIHRYADRIIANRAAFDHDADELRRRLRQPVAAP